MHKCLGRLSRYNVAYDLLEHRDKKLSKVAESHRDRTDDWSHIHVSDPNNSCARYFYHHPREALRVTKSRNAQDKLRARVANLNSSRISFDPLHRSPGSRRLKKARESATVMIWVASPAERPC
ncbi:hypothetical protein DTO271D3_5917 [Paecilomyces variotii]|nr:hypothetical protein DTO169E5_5466 [Paecilomyces variotii]KAJ9313823.1 hypothetical protein DTO271D3_5917 [Paecilomyces variotii]